MKLLKVWAALLLFSAIIWVVNAFQVVFDHSYHPDKFSLVIAFLITGGTVWKWAMEAWSDSEK